MCAELLLLCPVLLLHAGVLRISLLRPGRLLRSGRLLRPGNRPCGGML